MVKECIICGIEKDMLEFPYKTLSHKERKDTCKKCMRKFYAHENYKRNRKKKISKVDNIVKIIQKNVEEQVKNIVKIIKNKEEYIITNII